MTRADRLPDSYPFDRGTPGDKLGVWNAEELDWVWERAREARLDGVSALDFAIEDEDRDADINFLLSDLRESLRSLAATMDLPGPWQGVDLNSDDMAMACAELETLLGRLGIVALLESSFRKARIRAIGRSSPGYRQAHRIRRWDELVKEVTGLLRQAAPTLSANPGRDRTEWFDIRIANLDQVIAAAQLARAELIREHRIDIAFDGA
jgi:hypothetical protein